jgi:pyrimidine-nucleoside phosphorylase
MIDLIIKKRNGFELDKSEIETIINGSVSGQIPDYQMSAFLMAVFFQGMTNSETAMLTEVMMNSGDIIDLSEIPGIKVDKHSTGGVGDKTTLVLAPLVAAAGVPVPKISGRGLGHTGGTLDKMESIKGMSVNMTQSEFIDKVKEHNIAICGQNANLVPADKKLYALRDVTGTVKNFSLIASSIMSKKLACGGDAVVIDIKVGVGAYMKTVVEAEKLAKIMIEIGSRMNRKVTIVISSMEEPLGFSIGNALEIKEVIETLKGDGPEDLTEICLELGSHMLVLGEAVNNLDDARLILRDLINSGKGFEKFKEFVEAQGGDVSMIENKERLPKSEFFQNYKSKYDGYISKLNALDIGLASVKLGAGRETKTSLIDHGAGIVLKKKIGDLVKKDETLAILYSNNPTNFAKAIELMDHAYEIGEEPLSKTPLILKIMK